MCKSRKKWLCLDCRVDTGKIYEHYYVELELWMKVVGSKTGMLCIGCLEDRIDRKLTRKDFPNVTINSVKYGNKSLRLLNRLNGV